MRSSVPRSVPQSVPSSAAGGNVEILTGAQLGPYRPMHGSTIAPAVPQVGDPSDAPPQPGYGGSSGVSSQFNAGSSGAPSVPTRGFLFIRQPIDSHYTSEAEGRNPYYKVNNPGTRGMFTFIKKYANHISLGTQNRTADGFKVSGPQQRTSVMRVTPPPHGGGFAPETSAPVQLPQRGNTYRYNPQTGSQPYGTGVLNSDTFGAGQTAGGVGGNQYTPAPGPPPTNSVTSPQDASGMPVWG